MKTFHEYHIDKLLAEIGTYFHDPEEFLTELMKDPINIVNEIVHGQNPSFWQRTRLNPLNWGTRGQAARQVYSTNKDLTNKQQAMDNLVAAHQAKGLPQDQWDKQLKQYADNPNAFKYADYDIEAAKAKAAKAFGRNPQQVRGEAPSYNFGNQQTWGDYQTQQKKAAADQRAAARAAKTAQAAQGTQPQPGQNTNANAGQQVDMKQMNATLSQLMKFLKRWEKQQQAPKPGTSVPTP